MSDKEFSRRTLLHLLAVAAASGTVSLTGLGHAFGSQELGVGITVGLREGRVTGHFEEVAGGSVIILGAGLVGLVAAYELALAGYKVIYFRGKRTNRRPGLYREDWR